MKTHYFYNTEQAYAECQWNLEIETGDLLVIEREEVVGVAYTWPFAVTKKAGELHEIDPLFLDDLKNEFPTIVDAKELAKQYCFPTIKGV